MTAHGPERRRAARATVETSDVTRFRAFGAAALALTVTVIGLLALRSGPAVLVTPGALARPHQALACADCHADGERRASSSCGACHAAHPSARTAHAALARKGALGCGDCHAVHRSETGLAFETDGSVSLYGSGFEKKLAHVAFDQVPLEPGERPVFVPLVARETCARCHDPERATDPAWACFADATDGAFSLCFDEHRRPAGASGARAAERDAAVERARELAPRLPRARLANLASGGASLLVGAFAAGLVVFFAKRRARRAKSTRSSPLPLPATGVRRLPVVDVARCLGCQACVDACPYDVLEMVRYVAVPTRLEQCCGVGSCLVACPNGSLTLQNGPAPSMGPRLSARLESLDRAGIFLAGDVSGGSLIRNALEQGVKVAGAVAGELARSSDAARKRRKSDGSGESAFDLVVVGAGPAGLAAALAAKERELGVVVLEQASIAESIRRFSREKLVLDTPTTADTSLPLWIGDTKKEDLIRRWLREVHARALDVREHARVIGIDSLGPSAFRVRAVRADASLFAITARRVVVATGRRGSPRKLEASVPEPALGRVHYELSDARAFAGSRSVVVGLGDVAMETAIALALQPRTSVTVLHRGSGFSRGRQKNIETLARLAAEGRIGLLFETTVKRIRPRDLAVVTAGIAGAGEAARSIPYDALFVHIGSEADEGHASLW